jgi:hypothetical protein
MTLPSDHGTSIVTPLEYLTSVQAAIFGNNVRRHSPDALLVLLTLVGDVRAFASSITTT